jgi:hypothetical protein
LAAKDTDSDRYTRLVGNLLLSIAQKSLGSGVAVVNRKGSHDPQALFLVEIKDGGAISVSRVEANLKTRRNTAGRLKGKLARRGNKDGAKDQSGRRDSKGAPGGNGKWMADEVSQNYLDTIGPALRGASRRERESLLTMLILIDESFGMVVEQQGENQAGKRRSRIG